MNRSSGGQAQQGIVISADQMQPGDFDFYGSGRSIKSRSHVYWQRTDRTCFNGEDRHYRVNWNYRNPVKIVNVLG